jgi:hypothetical protein
VKEALVSSLVGQVSRTARSSALLGARRLSPVVPALCLALVGVPLAAPASFADEPAAAPAAAARDAAAAPAAAATTPPAETPATATTTGETPATEPTTGGPAGTSPTVRANPAPVAGPVQAGPVDAGPVQAGPVDAGPVEAGPVDAGPVQAGPVEPVPDKGVTRADLSVTVAGPATGWAGGEGAYTMTVNNAAAATAAASGFTLGYLVPAGQTVQSVHTAADADWACALSTEVSCTWFGELAPGAQTPPVTVVLSHGRRAGGTLTSTARVSAAADEVHLADNSRSVSTVMAAPELAVAVDAPDSVAPGAPVQLVLAVTNTGPGWASGFSVVGALPDGLQIRSIAGDGFDCDADLRSCTYTDVLGPGVTAQVAVAGTLPASYGGGPLTTTARLGHGGATATATAVTVVTAAPVAARVTAPVTAPVTQRPRVTPVAGPARVAAPRRPAAVAAPAAGAVRIPAASSPQPAGVPAAAPAATPSTLPFTGSRADDGLAAGVGLLLSGLLLTLAGRRRRTA